MDIIALTDTVKLYHIHDTRFKTESLSLHYPLIIRRECAAARYLLPSVLSAGCRRYSDEYSISARLEQLYGADIMHKVTRCGNKIDIGFYTECLDSGYTMSHEDLLPHVLEVLFSLIYEPLFDDAARIHRYIKQEKEQLLRELDEQDHRRDEYACHITRRLTAQDAWYRHPLQGTRGQIRGVDLTALREAYGDILSAPMYLIYHGSRSVEELTAWLPTALLRDHHKSQISPATSPATYECPLVRYRTMHYPIGQTHVVEGYTTDIRADHPLWSVYPVFMQLFSDAPMALLFRDVREKTASCYSCRALSDMVGGILLVTASAESGAARKISHAMRAALRHVQNGEFSDEDFKAAYHAALAGHTMLKDRRDAYEGWLSTQILLGMPLSQEKYTASLEAITKDMVIAFAKHFVRCAHVAVVGDGGAE